VSATRIGSFEILREVGRGGMGVVYLARDTRLDRQVAIKALPEDFASDPERLTRFEREAKTLASLSHPNVGGIYGVEEHDGKRHLILEYVEGQTLAERLEAGAIPIDETLELCVQVAAGLEAAHEAGVIHRDLKPGNIKITPEGKVKVLDFGLAKSAARPGSSSSLLRDSPTMSLPATPHSPTIPGAILGTAPYMSPEQARGRSVDKRSDIWSFGVILYECLTGLSPFTGETVSDSIGAILHKEPDLSCLPASTPALVRHLIVRCLQRDKASRLHDIADARIELEQARREPYASIAASNAAPRRRSALSLALAGFGVIALLGVGATIGYLMTRPRVSDAPLFAEISLPEEVRLVAAGDLAGPPVVSPDGSMIAFVAKAKSKEQCVWVRRLARAHADPLAGTEGATFPFWSPDSRSIGFASQGRLRRIDLATGATETVCEARAGRGGTWTTRGTILIAPGFQSPIFEVSADGGTPRQVTEIDASRHTSHRWPFALPDGEHFIFTAISHDPSKLEESALFLGSTRGGPAIRIARNDSSAEYVDGRVLFIHDGSLLAAPFDVGSGRMSGDAVPIVKGVAEDSSTWRGGFSASPSGVLAYLTGEAIPISSSVATPGSLSTGVSNVVVQVGRDGKPGSFWAEGVLSQGVSLSPGRLALATSATPPGAAGPDIWIYPLPSMEEREAKLEAAKQPSRITFRARSDISPTWSPDGQSLTYANVYTGIAECGIWSKQIGGGTERLLLRAESGNDIWPTDWTADGKHIIFTRGNWTPADINDIWALPLDGSPPFVLVATPKDDDEAQISPDGQWLAYASRESGNWEVYVIAFPPGWKNADGTALEPPAGKWRVSIAGGRRPRWRGDGTELYFLNPSGSLIAVQVDNQKDQMRFDSGAPLFQIGSDPNDSDFDVTQDGEQFFVQAVENLTDVPVSVVLNWQRLLESANR